MLDTTPITAQITRLIATGTTEQALLAAVAHMFPELSPADLSAALQDATAAAERRAARRPLICRERLPFPAAERH